MAAKITASSTYSLPPNTNKVPAFQRGESIVCLMVLENIMEDIRNGSYFIMEDLLFRDTSSSMEENPLAIALNEIECNGKKYSEGSIFRYKKDVKSLSQDGIKILYIRNITQRDIEYSLRLIEYANIFVTDKNSPYALSKIVNSESTPESVISEIRKIFSL